MYLLFLVPGTCGMLRFFLPCSSHAKHYQQSSYIDIYLPDTFVPPANSPRGMREAFKPLGDSFFCPAGPRWLYDRSFLMHLRLCWLSRVLRSSCVPLIPHFHVPWCTMFTVLLVKPRPARVCIPLPYCILVGYPWYTIVRGRMIVIIHLKARTVW